MRVEGRSVSHIQLAETLGCTSNLTLHSDGTTKFGTKYGSYQVSTDILSYSLGLAEMAAGTARNSRDLLLQILDDVDAVYNRFGGGCVSEKIITNIKNTMSDRQIVQKNFNQLLEDYRKEVLPSVVDGWSQISEDTREDAQLFLWNALYGWLS